MRAPKSKGATPSPVAYTLEYLVRTIGPDEEPQPEIEPNDQPAQAGALPARGTLTGRLDGDDDRDLVLLPFEPEGTTFRVELAAIAELALEVRLRSDKDVLSVARGGKGGELRLRNLLASPTVPLYLALRAVDGTSDTPYTLRVSTEPPLGDAAVEREPNDTVARANPLTPGGSVAGYLWPGDVDVYCAKEGLVFGARVDPLPDVDFRLELTDAAGKALHKADAGKRGAAEELPPDPRARCVRLSARSHDTAFETPYRLTFTE